MYSSNTVVAHFQAIIDRYVVFMLGVEAVRASIEGMMFDDAVDDVDLVISFLACGGRRPSRLSWNSAKASTSSNSFSQARWVPSAMYAISPCHIGRFEVPHILQSAVMWLMQASKPRCSQARAVAVHVYAGFDNPR